MGDDKVVIAGVTGEKGASSPYSLFSSDNPGALITSVQLKGENYNEWATEMMNALQAKRKTGFIDGTLTKPPEGHADLESRLSVNSMIVGWLRTSIEPRVRSTVTFITDAHKLWENLKERFSVGNKVRIHQLMSKLASCRQDGDAVIDYYGLLAKMWEELQTYRPPPACTCDAAALYEKEREDKRVHQFVMGLDESRFGHVVTAIIEADVLPDLGKVYNKVVREEDRLNSAKSREQQQDAVGFATRREGNNVDSRDDSSPQGGQNRGRDRVCSNCGRSGHDKSACWQIIGYPEWFTERGGRGTRGLSRGGGRSGTSRGRGQSNAAYATNANQSNVAYATNANPTGASSPEITLEQWRAISQILNEKSKSSEKSSGKNMGYVILDTGASHHMTGDIRLLKDLKEISPCNIGFADGSTTVAKSVGVLPLSDRISLHDVLYVPDLNCSLISVSKLLKHSNCFAFFTDTLCVLQDRCSKTLIGAGEERGGVYYFTDVRVARVNKAVKVESSVLWHRRLGHPAFSVLSSLPLFSGVGVSDSHTCEVCFEAKQTRESFSESSNKTSDCFELIHTDVWGPYRVKSSHGASYFLTIVDDYSRTVWTFLLLEKSDVKRMIQSFCLYAETQFGKTVKKVRSDNGTEFLCLSDFFKSKGIIHQTSCVATPQQNGRVERKHRHLLNVARSLLFQSSMPVKFWGEAIRAAAHVINLTPTKVLNGKCPHEVLFGSAQSYSDLRVFGSLCFAHKKLRDKNKFVSRSRKCVFVGYPFGKKGWQLYDLENNELFVSRDVIFREEEFPFSETVSNESTPLVAMETFDDVILLHEEGDGNVGNRGSSSVSTEKDQGVTSVSEDPAVIEIGPEVVPETEEQRNSDTATVVNPVVVPVTEEQLGRGQRIKTPSVLLNDYITYNAVYDNSTPPALTSNHSYSVYFEPVTGKTLYPLTEFISDDAFSVGHKAFVAVVCSEREPKNFTEAMRDKRWSKAVYKEVDALEFSHTWSVVDLPPGRVALGTMWVFKIKYNADGTVERFKARLVVLGNRQKAGSDYDETFAPVAKMTTVRSLLKIVAANNWEVHQMDVHNAFLHGDLHEEVYIKLPQGVTSSEPNKVCKLHKSLYGLKQAPRCWFEKLTKALIRAGFVQSYSDYSLFIYSHGHVEIRVLIYVDDLIICGNDGEAIRKFKNYLGECFHMKDLGRLKYFLGIEIARGKEGFVISQRKYALDIVEETGLTTSAPAATPMEQNHHLATDDSAFLTKPARYRRLVGRLIYLVNTRPDISYSVHILSQFMKKPREKHMDAALRVVRFLKGTMGQGILLKADTDLRLSIYCDADWAACPMTRRSLIAYVAMIGGSPVSWKTKKQNVVSHSSAEAEYRAMSIATREIAWLRQLLIDLGFAPQSPARLFCDSKSALHIASNPVFHERTKHVEINCHRVRDALKSGLLTCSYVGTKEQLADVLTKALRKVQFTKLMSKLGISYPHAPT